MAGMPKRRAMVAEIAKFAPEQTIEAGEARILELIAQGKTISQVAYMLSEQMAQGESGYDSIDPWTLSGWLRRTPDSSERLAHARKEAADALIDEHLDEARKTNEANARTMAVKTKALQFQVERRNREKYGQTQVSITNNIDLGSAFVAAMRAVTERPQHLVIEGETDADNHAE